MAEALAYLGISLVLAAGVAAVVGNWSRLTDWAHVTILAGSSVISFLVAGAARTRSERAAFRLGNVALLAGSGTLAAAAAVAATELLSWEEPAVLLGAGCVLTTAAGTSWRLMRTGSQLLAWFVGCQLVAHGALRLILDPLDPWLITASLLVVSSLWLALSATGRLEPHPFGVAMSAATIAYAPIVSLMDGAAWGELFGAGVGVGLLTLSVPMREPILLGVGSVTTFFYLTSALLRTFGERIGAPAALALAGVALLVLAYVTRSIAPMASRRRRPGSTRRSNVQVRSFGAREPQPRNVPRTRVGSPGPDDRG